jgi:hypothetical protein
MVRSPPYLTKGCTHRKFAIFFTRHSRLEQDPLDNQVESSRDTTEHRIADVLFVFATVFAVGGDLRIEICG